MLIELAWFAHRPVWHLIFGGVLERHPNLRVVLTEQGAELDPTRARDARLVPPAHDAWAARPETVFFGAVAKEMSLTPTEYFQRNFWVGRQLPAPVGEPAALRHRHRPDHVGRRLPALRGQLPVHDRSAARRVRRRARRTRPRRWSRRTRPRVYGFDLAALREARRSHRADGRGRAACRSIRPTTRPTRRATRSTRSRSSRPGDTPHGEQGSMHGDDSIRRASTRAAAQPRGRGGSATRSGRPR